MPFVRTAFVVAALTTSALASATVLVAQHRATDLTGNWTFAVVTENGTGTPAVVMKQQGDSLSGTYGVVPYGRAGIQGQREGQGVHVRREYQRRHSAHLQGTIVDDDHVKGDVDFAGQGGATFTGERRR